MVWMVKFMLCKFYYNFENWGKVGDEKFPGPSSWPLANPRMESSFLPLTPQTHLFYHPNLPQLPHCSLAPWARPASPPLKRCTPYLAPLFHFPSSQSILCTATDVFRKLNLLSYSAAFPSFPSWFLFILRIKTKLCESRLQPPLSFFPPKHHMLALVQTHLLPQGLCSRYPLCLESLFATAIGSFCSFRISFNVTTSWTSS